MVGYWREKLIKLIRFFLPKADTSCGAITLLTVNYLITHNMIYVFQMTYDHGRC